MQRNFDARFGPAPAALAHIAKFFTIENDRAPISC
jgi:hypothetical protein